MSGTARQRRPRNRERPSPKSQAERERELARERRRRARARANAGLISVRVVVNAGDVGDLLREAGFIDPLSEDDAKTLGAGIEKMIAAVTRDATDFEIVPR